MTETQSPAGPFRIGLLGHGTVGAAFDELLAQRADRIQAITGLRPVLSGVLTRQLAREGRLSRLHFDIVDRPGQLAAVVTVLSNAGANIVEVSHQRIFTDLPAKAVVLEVVIETRDRSHLTSTIEALRAADIKVEM